MGTTENEEGQETEAEAPLEPADVVGAKRRFWRGWWPKKQSGDKPDPPHPLGLSAQVFGPVMTLVALGFTIYFANQQFENANKALAISEQHMKIGQRAYLAARNGTLLVKYFTGKDFEFLPLDFRSKGPIVNTIAVFPKFELHNLGNTPARDIDLLLVFSKSDSWLLKSPLVPELKVDPSSQIVRIANLGDIAPKSFMEHVSEVPFDLAGEAIQQLELEQEAAIDGNDQVLIRIQAIVNYSDSFGARHSISWCWNRYWKEPYPQACKVSTAVLSLLHPL